MLAYIDNYEDALQDVNKSISLDNESSFSWGTRGTIKWLLGDYEAALADFTKADELLKDGSVHQMEIAVTFYKMEEILEAIAQWKIATSDNSDFHSAAEYQEKYRFPPPFYEAMQELEKLANNN